MKMIQTIIPKHVVLLLKRLGIVLGLLYISRIVFLIFNSAEFQDLNATDFIAAIWLDLITIGLFFLPYYGLYLIPVPFRESRLYKWFFKLLFHITTILLLALNLLDVEYFKYTSKRSTYDLFTIVGAGDDVKQLLGTFVKDFWFLILILIILILTAEWLYRRVENKAPINFSLKKEALSLIVFAPLLFLMGRGGLAVKPTGIIEATNYTTPENLAFVLNTPFTMIKTIDQSGIELVNYFPQNEADKYFNPIKQSEPQHILNDSNNVVIIMLESFGTEFVGKYNNGNGYTPFLDSILSESLYFEYGFANGKKSIEAVPAVFASIPSFMDFPYISSMYGDNKLDGLPAVLKKHGYSSAFYHGATNGSMRFDGFSKICGFEQYFGRYEYDNDEHFDKTWGILDEYFNPWAAKEMSNLKEPFCAGLFTLSSHHPYFIPEHMRDEVKRGPQQICASISYGDYALKEFFEEAQKQPWYEKTLFIILADHTPSSTTPEYHQRTHLYRIPIAFFHPSGKLKAEKSENIFQQLDILPTTLDLLNIKTDYYAFGNSYYNNTDKEAIAYLSGTYHYFRDGHMISFNQEKARNLYDFRVLSKNPIDSIEYYREDIPAIEKRIKAMIQRHNFDLIMNQTTIDEKENTLHN